MIDRTRIRRLTQRSSFEGKYVLYWMQQSQRTRFNHALEHAIFAANSEKLPLIVCFGLMDDYPEANARHYAFMLQGLADVRDGLRKRNIQFVLRRGRPADVAIELGRDAAFVVCDRGYLRHQKQWRDEFADAMRCNVVEVESDVVVPVDTMSDKAEYAARTIRPKIHKHWKRYLKPLAATRVKRSSLGMKLRSDRITLDTLKVDCSVPPSTRFVGGELAARKLLQRFVRQKLKGYADGRNDPSLQQTSTLSPYLHFGQISPIEIALAARGSAEFLEELIVRRELAINFCNFTPNYDRYESLPMWAKKTLAQHRRDKRPVIYSLAQLESAASADPHWNAAQREMTKTGYMHNYMRMYWGKKIIEWSRTPQSAYETAIYLNNKYFLDGRDPSAWTNVGWLFGLHDRPWGPPRKIFGLVRYMNAAGLERKFDMDAYVKWVDSL